MTQPVGQKEIDINAWLNALTNQFIKDPNQNTTENINQDQNTTTESNQDKLETEEDEMLVQSLNVMMRMDDESSQKLIQGFVDNIFKDLKNCDTKEAVDKALDQYYKTIAFFRGTLGLESPFKARMSTFYDEITTEKADWIKAYLRERIIKEHSASSETSVPSVTVALPNPFEKFKEEPFDAIDEAYAQMKEISDKESIEKLIDQFYQFAISIKGKVDSLHSTFRLALADSNIRGEKRAWIQQKLKTIDLDKLKNSSNDYNRFTAVFANNIPSVKDLATVAIKEIDKINNEESFRKCLAELNQFTNSKKMDDILFSIQLTMQLLQHIEETEKHAWFHEFFVEEMKKVDPSGEMFAAMSNLAQAPHLQPDQANNRFNKYVKDKSDASLIDFFDAQWNAVTTEAEFNALLDEVEVYSYHHMGQQVVDKLSIHVAQKVIPLIDLTQNSTNEKDSWVINRAMKRFNLNDNNRST